MASVAQRSDPRAATGVAALQEGASAQRPVSFAAFNPRLNALYSIEPLHFWWGILFFFFIPPSPLFVHLVQRCVR